MHEFSIDLFLLLDDVGIDVVLLLIDVEADATGTNAEGPTPPVTVVD